MVLENKISTCKRMNWTLNFIPCTNINSKWINSLIIRPEILELLEEKLFYIGLGVDFLGRSPKTQVTKAKIKKWDYIKLENFCKTQKTISKMKKKDYGLYLYHVSDKRLILKI
jgi:hypothetical protein